jgi:lactoylglutathione lyase
MIEKLARVALSVDDQEAAERFWTQAVRCEVRAKRSSAAAGHCIEIAPPKAESCLILFSENADARLKPAQTVTGVRV